MKMSLIYTIVTYFIEDFYPPGFLLYSSKGRSPNVKQ